MYNCWCWQSFVSWWLDFIPFNPCFIIRSSFFYICLSVLVCCLVSSVSYPFSLSNQYRFPFPPQKNILSFWELSVCFFFPFFTWKSIFPFSKYTLPEKNVLTCSLLEVGIMFQTQLCTSCCLPLSNKVQHWNVTRR